MNKTYETNITVQQHGLEQESTVYITAYTKAQTKQHAESNFKAYCRNVREMGQLQGIIEMTIGKVEEANKVVLVESKEHFEM